MFALRSIIVIVVSSTISNVHSGRILLGKEAASRMNGRLGDSDMNSFVRRETSQGSNQLENQMYANVDYSIIKRLPSSAKRTLGRNPSQELNDNKPIYSQEKLKFSRSKHISGNHRQIFKTRNPFHFNKHLQVISHSDNISPTNVLSTKSLRDPETNHRRRGPVTISQTQFTGSHTYFKNRRPISAAKTDSFKQIHNDRIITASSVTGNGFRKGFEGHKFRGTFHGSIYPSSVAVMNTVETSTLPATETTEIIPLPPLLTYPDHLLSGFAVLCTGGFIFNGNNECVCPVGYIVTRSQKCIAAYGSSFED